MSLDLNTHDAPRPIILFQRLELALNTNVHHDYSPFNQVMPLELAFL